MISDDQRVLASAEAVIRAARHDDHDPPDCAYCQWVAEETWIDLHPDEAARLFKGWAESNDERNP